MSLCIVLALVAVVFIAVGAILGLASLFAASRSNPAEEIYRTQRAAEWQIDQASREYRRRLYNLIRR